MQTLRVVFTTRAWNPVSFAIRCANPVSFTTIAPASHAMVLDGDTGYVLEASMHGGVRRVPYGKATEGCVIVAVVDYNVPDAEAGLQWFRDTALRGAKYDWPGAFGLGIAPGRSWQDESDWFCFEAVAMCILKAGRETFADHAHVTAYMLMSLEP